MRWYFWAALQHAIIWLHIAAGCIGTNRSPADTILGLNHPSTRYDAAEGLRNLFGIWLLHFKLRIRRSCAVFVSRSANRHTGHCSVDSMVVAFQSPNAADCNDANCRSAGDTRYFTVGLYRPSGQASSCDSGMLVINGKQDSKRG